MTDPLALGIERDPPGPVLDRARGLSTEFVGLLSDVGQRPGSGVTPACDAGVRGEHDRSAHTVAQGIAVGVGHVSRRDAPLIGVLVGDVRNLFGTRAKRGSGHEQLLDSRVERLDHRFAPGQSITGMVDFIHHDQGPAMLGTVAVQDRPGGDLGIRGHVAVHSFGEGDSGLVGTRRVKVQAEFRCGVGPLLTQMVGGGDDDNLVDPAATQLRRGDCEGEARLARTGGSTDCEGVTVVGVERRYRLALPCSQPHVVPP